MYHIRILVNGRPIPVYRDKEGNSWIEARKDSEFSIKVYNDYFNRILGIISVDGINVINGEHKDPNDSPGYIINANDSIEIAGWLVDRDKVKKFKFSKIEESYSNKIGRETNNVGVIGVAVYSEKIIPYITYSMNSNSKNFRNNFMPTYYNMNVTSVGNSFEPLTSTVSSDNLVPVRSEKLGVGSGEKIYNPTYETTFNRERLETIMNLYYDTKENLIANGIMLRENKLPLAFPQTGYCPDV